MGRQIASYHNWLMSWTVSPESVGSSPIGVTIENIKEVFVEKRVIARCLRVDGEMV